MNQRRNKKDDEMKFIFEKAVKEAQRLNLIRNFYGEARVAMAERGGILEIFLMKN